MTAAAKLAIFGLALIVVFAASIGIGRAVGPDRAEDHGGHPAVSSSDAG